MSDSPVGWGDKTMDGTGTGLERGGDPPEQDKAARQAAELLPCSTPGFCELVQTGVHAADCAARFRPAVAATLREKDTAHDALMTEEMKYANELRERIAALEAETQKMFGDNLALGDRLAVVEADNERLRAALEKVPHITLGGATTLEPCPTKRRQDHCAWAGGRCAALAGRKPE